MKSSLLLASILVALSAHAESEVKPPPTDSAKSPLFTPPSERMAPQVPCPVADGAFGEWFATPLNRTYRLEVKPQVGIRTNHKIYAEMALPEIPLKLVDNPGYVASFGRLDSHDNFFVTGGSCVLTPKKSVHLHLEMDGRVLDVFPILTPNGSTDFKDAKYKVNDGEHNFSGPVAGVDYDLGGSRGMRGSRLDFRNDHFLYEVESVSDFPAEFVPDAIFGLPREYVFADAKGRDLPAQYVGGLFTVDKGFVVDLAKNPELAALLARSLGTGPVDEKATRTTYPLSISGKVTIRPAFYSSIGRMDVSGRTLLFEISYYCVDVIGDVHTAKSGESQSTKVSVSDRFIYSIGRPIPVRASWCKPDLATKTEAETKVPSQTSTAQAGTGR